MIKRQYDERRLLIIGRSMVNKHHLTIVDVSLSDPYILFGNCELSKACDTAKNNGASVIHAMAIESDTDYVHAANIVCDMQYDYIVPLISMDKQFYDGASNRSYTYASYFMTTSYGKTDSTYLFTCTHASLFEQIDDYLSYLKQCTETINTRLINGANINGRNIVFVENGIVDNLHANVLIASRLCASSLNEHPTIKKVETVFTIHPFDMSEINACYVSSNSTQSTIKHLINFSDDEDMCRYVIVNDLVKDIFHNLNFEDILGLPDHNEVKFLIEDELTNLLKQYIGKELKDASIKQVKKKKVGQFVTGYTVDFSICPYGVLSDIDLHIEEL